MKIQTLTATLTLALLTACGGGGDGSPNTDSGNHNPSPVNSNMGKRYVMPLSPEDDDDKSITRVEWKRDGTTIAIGEYGKDHIVNGDKLPIGFASFPVQIEITGSNGKKEIINRTARSYQGYHAGALAIAPMKSGEEPFWDDLYVEYLNPTTQLPNSDKATYTGHAFNDRADNDSALRYTINFSTRRGSGEIAASRSLGRIVLQEAAITKREDGELGDLTPFGVYRGQANVDGQHFPGTYNVAIAGPNAEEILGTVDYSNPAYHNATDSARQNYPIENTLHFHGTRGDITP